MKIIDTYKQRIQAEKEGIKIPTSVQSLIPISKIREDGLFRTGKNYSKVYSFSDINYTVAAAKDKESMFKKYCEILNTLDTEAITKITINNKNLDKKTFEEEIFFPMQNDGLDKYRHEYNDMIEEKVEKARNNIVQERYMTISTQRKDILDAKSFFNRVDVEIQDVFAGLGSSITPLDCTERLKIYHDFYRVGNEDNYIFDYKQAMRKMHDFKSSICPCSMEVNKKHIQIGDKYVRTLYMREYANFIEDKMITDITDLQKIMMLSINLLPIPTDEAAKIIDRLIMGVQTDKARFTRKQNQNGNFTAEIPYELEQRTKELHEFMDDLQARDQRMIFATITLTLVADSLEELDSLTKSVQSLAAGKYSCDFTNLTFQQVDGLNTTLPIGVHKLPFKWRTLTTESSAVLMPFKAQEIKDKQGIYYGVNNISKNLIILDRTIDINGNGFVLGTSGSGKSFKAKEEIINLILRNDDVDIICVDPESEYGKLISGLGGEVVKISASSQNHVNAMDITKNYADGKDPIILKSVFILTLCEQLMEGEKITAVEKSIIDRCVRITYEDYIKNNYKGKAPTLVDFRNVLLEQPEKEARRIALALERFADGTLSTFAKQTNVDIHSQYLVYDIHDLDPQLYSVGMLVILDSIMNRISVNRAKGRPTFVYVDEIYLMYKKQYSATFLSELWKRIRKYGGCATGITQNISDLLQSKEAEVMLSNSEFLILMQQSPSDLEKLARLLKMSETQLSYISDKRSKHTNRNGRHGLLKYGDSMIPFVDKFPKDTELYKMLTTNPKEQEGYNHD